MDIQRTVSRLPQRTQRQLEGRVATITVDNGDGTIDVDLAGATVTVPLITGTRTVGERVTLIVWDGNLVALGLKQLDHGGLSGLADNDHPQYALGSEDVWTPTFNSGVTQGNGVWAIARWFKLGGLVFVQADFTHGTTTSVTGEVRLNLPVNTDAAGTWVWSSSFYNDGGVRVSMAGAVQIIDLPPQCARFFIGADWLKNTHPTTWVTGDVWQFRLWYPF